jgi:hypothetical protein
VHNSKVLHLVKEWKILIIKEGLHESLVGASWEAGKRCD